MNFKDLQFSLGKFSTSAYSHLARKNPLMKQDTKALSNWIFEERNELYVMRMLAYHRTETNRAFVDWTKEERQEGKEADTRDLEDIGSKLAKLLDKQTEVEEAYTGKYQQYRRAIKAIREREDKLSDIREKKRVLQGRIHNLQKSSSKSPKLRDFTRELESLERDTHDREMEMGDFKRFALREAFYLRFNALHEMAEKLAIIAGFGKYMVDLLDIEPTPPGQPERRPYEKGPEIAQMFADCCIALESWAPYEGQQRPTLAEDEPAATHELDDDDVKDTANDAGGLASASSSASKEPKKTDPPALPPRRSSVSKPPLEDSSAGPSTPLDQQQPSGYSAGELAQTTGDVKTDSETEVNLDQLDLYGPPPAYSDATNAQPSAPSSSTIIQNETQQQQQPPQQQQQLEDSDQFSPRNTYEPDAQPQLQPSFNPPPPPRMPPRVLHNSDRSDMHEEKVLDEQGPAPSSSSSVGSPAPFGTPISASAQLYSQSPQPYHAQQQQQQTPQQHHYSLYHQNSMASTMTAGSVPPYQSNYNQLYRQMSHRQRHQQPQIPYSQFQQQFRPANERIDAGGFRIPVRPSPSASNHPTAEEEKQALAERYGSN